MRNNPYLYFYSRKEEKIDFVFFTIRICYCNISQIKRLSVDFTGTNAIWNLILFNGVDWLLPIISASDIGRGDCSQWGYFSGYLTRIYVMIEENHGKLRSVRPTGKARSRTRNLRSTSFEG